MKKTLYLMLLTASFVNHGVSMHYESLPRMTYKERVDALAITLDDNGELWEQVNQIVPIPQRKPEQGYTLAYIKDFNDFIKGFE